MVTKEDLSQEINDVLDTNIDFSKMTKDDLQHLEMLVKEGHLIEPMAKHIASEKSQEVVDEKVKSWQPGSIVRRMI